MARDQPEDRSAEALGGEPERELEVDLEDTGYGETLEAALGKTVEKLLRRWRKRNILVLGFTGVGKTSLLRYMFGLQSQDEGQPTTRANRYIFKIGDTTFRAVDTPGHPTFKDLLDTEIDSLLGGTYHGVINVTAFGYSQPQHGRPLREEDNPYTPVLKGGRPNPRYLERTRELEIEYMQAWASLLDPRAKLKWVLTVVNKLDLWMSSEEAVVEHYGPTGAYGQRLTNLIGDVPQSVLHMTSKGSGKFFHTERKRSPSPEKRQNLKRFFARVLHARLSGRRPPSQ